MIINCPYAEETSVRNTIKCKLDKHGGLPHISVCKVCLNSNKPIQNNVLVKSIESIQPIKKPVIHQPMPGNVLGSIISKLGYKQTSGCNCNEMQQQMNSWGWSGCLYHQQEIVNWLIKKAKDEGIEIESKNVYGLLKEAFKQVVVKTIIGDGI